MNWGYKIVLGLGTFMIFIVGAGIYMVTNDSDTLVETDYYEQGLKYDETYHKLENLQKDNARPGLKISNDTLHLTFKNLENKGYLIFQRMDKNDQDKKLPFASNTQNFNLPLSSFPKGKWKLRIDWMDENESYISDHEIFIP